MNRLLTRILRSPLAGTVDGSLALLTVRGWRTGRDITLPVQYAAGEHALWVWVGHAEAKSWWRNLRTRSPVHLRLQGHEVDARARAVTGDDEPGTVEHGLRAYAARFPATARRAGVAPASGGEQALAEVARRTVMVRVDLPSEELARTREATMVRGHRFAAWVRRHPLAAYFLAAFAFSWGYWIPAALAGGDLSHFPGLLGPMLAALAVTAITGGSAVLRELLGRMVRWRVPLRWYAAALVPVAVGLVALGALWLITGDLPSVDRLSFMPGLPAVGWAGVAVLVFLINGYGEETGWRGFAWPRLRQRHTLGGAALILALPWAVWHVPTFWLDTGLRGFPAVMIPGFLVGMAAGAVVLGWLYERAGSSIPVVALWHAVFNMASATEGTEGAVAAAVSTAVIFWAVAILRRRPGGGDPSPSNREGTASIPASR